MAGKILNNQQLTNMYPYSFHDENRLYNQKVILVDLLLQKGDLHRC